MNNFRKALRCAALFASASALAVAATPAAAATLIVTHGATAPIASNNNFATQLGLQGLTSYTTAGATIALSGPARITFHFMGSESGFDDTFTFLADSFTGANTETETSAFTSWAARFVGTGQYNLGGDLAGLLNFTTTSPQGASATIGQEGFGIFLPANAVSGGGYTTLFLGYDDQRSLLTPPDDNHDDFMVRMTVTAIPEPATWAMLIGGFGLVGAAMRRRSQTTVALA